MNRIIPKLSIITINLNNAPGLKKTIESVVSQTSGDFEFLVIDGGSTDRSLDIIRQNKDKIFYWSSEKDKGIYHAMNKGILASTGEYCQFLNSGDYLLDSTVTERMLADLPDFPIVYGNKTMVVNGREVVEKSFAGRQITLLDMYRSTLFHACAYIKRSLFEKYGLYDQSLRIVSDWKFYLTAVGLHGERVFYRDIDMVWFDPGGISSTNKELDRKEREAVLKSVLPESIRCDYQNFARDSIIISRLKKNKIAWFIVVNIYRLLFRFDKFFGSNKI